MIKNVPAGISGLGSCVPKPNATFQSSAEKLEPVQVLDSVRVPLPTAVPDNGLVACVTT